MEDEEVRGRCAWPQGFCILHSAFILRVWSPVRESHRLHGFANRCLRCSANGTEKERRGRKLALPPTLLCHLRGVLERSAQWRMKSAMTAGAVASKPTTSNMPRSFGSARVKPLEVMPTTTAFASPTNSLRY